MFYLIDNLALSRPARARGLKPELPGLCDDGSGRRAPRGRVD